MAPTRCLGYLAVFAVVCNGVILSAVVAGEQVGVAARNLPSQVVEVDEGSQEPAAGWAPLESGVGQGRVDRVFAAVAHPESVQHVTPAPGHQVAAAHLLFVRFLQIIKALSRLSTVGGAGRRTERLGGRATRPQVDRRGGGLQLARRQPGVDDLERRGGGERQASHQEQRQARRGPGHSAGQGAVATAAASAAARSSAATGAGSIAAGGRSAPPRGSECPRGPCAGAR